MGCSVKQPYSDKKNLVSTGTGASHQLPGVTGSVSSIASIWEDLDGYSSALPFGQCNSSNIHQPEKRHSLQTAAITIWNWCIARSISLMAEHLSGHLNTIADQESRTVQDPCDWMLNPHVFRKQWASWRWTCLPLT